MKNKRKKKIVNIIDWRILPRIAVGLGTRDKIVLRRTKRAKIYYIVKSFDKDIGELRSEVCASNIGKTCSFSVQKAQFCLIPQYKKLGLKKRQGVLIKLDITRQKDPRSKKTKFKEDLLHGIDLISKIDPTFSSLKDERERRSRYTLDLVIKALKKYIAKNPDASSLWEQFFELIVFDALIGSTDRHYRNWGILVNREGRRKSKFIKLAPAFDNGISLLWKKELTAKTLNYKSMYAAPSPFRKKEGGQYKLFELCETLSKIPEIQNTTAIKTVIDKIDAITDKKLRKAIFKLTPQNKRFDSEKVTLGIVYEYVNMRLRILREILHKLYGETSL